MSIITTTIATSIRMKKMAKYSNFFCFFSDGSQLHTIVRADNLFEACTLLASHNSIKDNDYGSDLEKNFVDWINAFSHQTYSSAWIESWEKLVGEDSAYRVKPWADMIESGGIFQYDQDGWEGFCYDRGQDTIEDLVPYMSSFLLIENGMPMVFAGEDCRRNVRANLEEFMKGERLDHDQVEEEYKKWKEAKRLKIADTTIPYKELVHLDLEGNMESKKKIGVKVEDIVYLFVMK